MAGSIEEQLVDSSRIIADLVVAHIGYNNELFDEALSLMLEDKYPVSMRAARVVQLVTERHPEMIRPYIETLIENLPTSKVDGVRRAILSILIGRPFHISEDSLGKLADWCFGYIDDENQPIAIRAQSIDILVMVAKTYPEIIPELIEVMEKIMPSASTGLKGKCRKTILFLQKKAGKN